MIIYELLLMLMANFYLAYGSNLYTPRIKLSATSAQKVAKDYKIDFCLWSERWKGACATIVPSPGDVVWGVIWLIQDGDKAKLDIQENIHQGVYELMTLECQSYDGKSYHCFTYMLKMKDSCKIPSKLYKNVIIRGAQEHELPEHYIKHLNSFEDNGYDEKFDVFKDSLAYHNI